MADLQTTVIVPDVSFWQDKNDTPQMIDFAKMKAAGAPGVIIRAGQGSWTDADFVHNWQAAKASGLLRGAYWFYDSRYAPLSQAALFANSVKNDMPEMELWCDYEENYRGAFAGWKHFAVFVAEVQKLLPAVKVGIYTGYYYWMDHSPDPVTEAASLAWFGKLPLWLAWYSSANVVKIPAPWTKATYWQYTDKGDGLKYGVESLGIDLSYFNGSLADFSARYNGATPPQVSKLYVVKDDLWAGTYVRNGYPATKRYRGGKGSVKLSPEWLEYAWKINQPRWAYQFVNRELLKKYVGWCNQGVNVVEQLTFAGNILRGVPAGDHVYIETYQSDALPPAVRLPDEIHMDTKIQMFSTQYPTYTDMTTNGRNPRTVLLSNPGEKVYMSANELAEISMIEKSVKVTAFPALRVRAWPSTAGAIQRSLIWNTSVYVNFYTQIGNDIWGRVAGGWIGMRVGGYYNTSWRP
jgi:GH25 family lysozyme M1 (1,4-beta-N-acetylmuramidase)